MPRFRITQSWSETRYYSNSVIVEADDEDEARDLANDDQDMSDSDSDNSEYNDGSWDISDVQCAECDRQPRNCRCDLPADEATSPSQPEPCRTPIRVKKYARNIPDWM